MRLRPVIDWPLALSPHRAFPLFVEAGPRTGMSP